MPLPRSPPPGKKTPQSSAGASVPSTQPPVTEPEGATAATSASAQPVTTEVPSVYSEEATQKYRVLQNRTNIAELFRQSQELHGDLDQVRQYLTELANGNSAVA